MNSIERIAFVTPWYGARSGGAEILCQNLARRLAADGRCVEVWTTCSLDPFHPWGENAHPEGESHDDGVLVRRFPVSPRDADVYARADRRLHAAPEPPEASTEIDLFGNSVNSDALAEHARAAGPETLVCFLPYLYGTTVNVLPLVRAPTLLIPCLHDEPYAYTSLVQRAFERATGALFLSRAEQRLAATMFDLTPKPHGLLGVGVEREAPGDASAFRAKFGVEGPFVFFCGRRVPGKGFDVLLDCFSRAACDARLQGLKLVISGAGDDRPGTGAPGEVLDLGFLADEDLANALAAAAVFCQPSFMESFSIVLMQAWLEGRPALVNAACDVTREHCLACNGGLWFSDHFDFTEALVRLLESPREAGAMGRNGRDYVETQYNWRAVTERFNAIVDGVEALGQP